MKKQEQTLFEDNDMKNQNSCKNSEKMNNMCKFENFKNNSCPLFAKSTVKIAQEKVS